MAQTSCQLFADNGCPMDSRVRPDVGLTREPARSVVRVQRDGFVHIELSRDWTSYEELPPATRPVRHPTPVERPDPQAVERSAQARRDCNRRRRAAQARITIRV